MGHQASWLRAGMMVMAWMVLGWGQARGEVKFLVVSGGPDVYHNEVFFEKNVGFFRETLKAMGMGAAARRADVLFAGGKDVGEGADISYLDAKEEAPRVNQLLSRIFDGQGDVNVRYRPHEVKRVAGGATKKEITAWFEKTGAEMNKGDVLVIYVTTHGGGSGNAMEVGKSTIALWNNESMSVEEFTRLLDKLPAGVRVATVMVQCYCGGFGEIVYEAGLPPGRVSPRSRVGFFATLSTLTATGCTTSTRDDTYTDYSTNFFAALGGHDRSGKEIEKSKLDLDGDGKVSMAEAHAYAELAESVDIPTTTSELYLRRVSKMDGAKALEGATFKELRVKAGAVRGGVLDGLAKELGLATWRPAATAPTTRPARGRRGAATRNAVRESMTMALSTKSVTTTRPAGDWLTAAFGVINECEAKSKELDERGKKLGERYHAAKNEIERTLVSRWPELAVTWHPRLGELLNEQSEEIVRTIETHSAYSRFKREWEAWDALQDEQDKVHVRRAQVQRFLRTAATVALEGHLGEVGGKEREVYRKLVEEEGRGMGE